MIELTPLEQAALKGQSTDKARAAAEKAEEAQAKRAASEQQTQAERHAEFTQLASLEAGKVTAEIAATVAKFIEPIRSFSPAITLSDSHFVTGLTLQHEEEQRQLQISQLTELANGATDSINEKLVENATLALSREPMNVGKVGLNFMDIEVLTGIVDKAKAAIEEIPPEYANYGLAAWEQAVKSAKSKALFDTLATCEAVMVEIMRDLRASGDISPNYYRAVKMPWN